MSKDLTLLQEVIFIHHPLFKKNKKMRKIATKNPEIFKVERLVEQAMAVVGGYDFVDADGYDFSDYTECKTSSVSSNPVKKYPNNYSGYITGVARDDRLKLSDLRVVIYNPIREKVQYYYIPKKTWSLYVIGSTKEKFLKFNYHKIKRSSGWLSEFEVDSFETLAKIVAPKYIKP